MTIERKILIAKIIRYISVMPFVYTIIIAIINAFTGTTAFMMPLTGLSAFALTICMYILKYFYIAIIAIIAFIVASLYLKNCKKESQTKTTRCTYNPEYSPLIEACLMKIKAELDRCYFNKNQKEMNSPFDNTGESYSNDVFSVKAYNWGEEGNITPNFKYKDLNVFWYKHFRRGMSYYYADDKNSQLTSDFLSTMLNECTIAIREDFGE